MHGHGYARVREGLVALFTVYILCIILLYAHGVTYTLNRFRARAQARSSAYHRTQQLEPNSTPTTQDGIFCRGGWVDLAT